MENIELNPKNFPSKVNVCRGGFGSSLGLKTFNSQSSNSPIVNYYASGEQKYYLTNTNNTNNSSLRGSFHDHNFNFSPSTIFNKRNSSSSTSMQMQNGGNTPSTNKGPNGMIGKTLQEKIEGNFAISPDLDLDDIEVENGNGNINEKTEDDEEEPKTGLYMLSFNSDEVENSDEDLYSKNYVNNLGELDSNMPIQSRINKAMKKNSSKKKIEQLSPIPKHTEDEEQVENYNLNTSPNAQLNIPMNQIVSNGETNYITHLPLHQENRNINHLTQNETKDLSTTNNEPETFEHSPSNSLPLSSNVNTKKTNQFLNQNLAFQQHSSLTKKSKKGKRLDPSVYNNLSLEELVKNIYSLASDQGGCRHLQKLVEEDPIKSVPIIYQPLVDEILKLVNDPFGNYLIQKLFQFLSPDQLQQIIVIFSPHIFDIGSNPHGTRVLQHLINYLSNDYLKEYFLSVIIPFVIPLLKDLNGTHIVQKFAFDNPKYAPVINKIIIDNSHSLATNRHGCCVIQKYFELFTGELLEQLLDKLIENCSMLVIDQFGNYVIQTILQMNNTKCGNEISSKIAENVSYYAKHKYSSNVVEKCFDYCDGVVKQKLICNIIKPEIIQDLILDEHGNYIIQKALSCSDSETQRIMLQIIVPLFDKIKKVPFGERIITRLTKSYPHFIKANKNPHGFHGNDNNKKKGKHRGGHSNRGGYNSYGYNNKKNY